MKLQNQEIWLAYAKLVELSKIKFPIKTSLGIAKLLIKLRQPYAAIEHERSKLVNHYGVENKATRQVTVSLDSPKAGDFAREFGELLTEYWDEEIEFEKVKLPEKITGNCDACHHNMDVVFLLDPETLMPLTEKFVEV